MDSSRNNTEPLPNPPALQSPVGSLSSLSSFVTFVVICLVKWHTRSQWRGLRKGEHSGVAWKRQSRVTVPPSAKKKTTCKNVLLWLRTSTLAYMFAHKLVFPSGVGDHATALSVSAFWQIAVFRVLDHLYWGYFLLRLSYTILHFLRISTAVLDSEDDLVLLRPLLWHIFTIVTMFSSALSSHHITREQRLSLSHSCV